MFDRPKAFSLLNPRPTTSPDEIPAGELEGVRQQPESDAREGVPDGELDRGERQSGRDPHGRHGGEPGEQAQAEA
jgi:hypothetical protein